MLLTFYTGVSPEGGSMLQLIQKGGKNETFELDRILVQSWTTLKKMVWIQFSLAYKEFFAKCLAFQN